MARAKRKSGQGYRTVDPPTQGDVKTLLPSARAYLQVQQRIGGHFTSLRQIYDAQNDTNPNSEQWLMKGLHDWLSGMKKATGLLSISASQEARDIHQNLEMERAQYLFMSREQQEHEWDVYEEQLGGIPSQDSQGFCNLANAVVMLGTKYLFLEIGGKQNRSDYICAPPRVLENIREFTAYQTMAVLYTVMVRVNYLCGALGPTVQCSRGLIDAAVTYFHNMRAPFSLQVVKEQDPSPQEIVEYMKRLIENGTMDWSLFRTYVSTQYRGCILFGVVLAMMGQPAEGYKHLKWATEFIDGLDEEFGVSKDKDYERVGIAFKPSMRAGIMVALSELHRFLQGDDIDGPYSMADYIDLCLEISTMAKRFPEVASDYETGYCRVEAEAFFQRKPMAKAHSAIAASLKQMAQRMDLKDFKVVAHYHGFIESTDTPCDSFGLVAEHYRIAAENEFSDAEESAILWWAHAGNMVQANPAISGYTVGQLRRAIEKAEAAEEARNIALFGENTQRGGSYEKLGKVVAVHFQDKPESFMLPMARIVDGEGQEQAICIGSEIICENYHESFSADERQTKSKPHFKLPGNS